MLIRTLDVEYYRLINSIYDPLGFLAPVVIEGKLLMRQVISSTNDWDEPLPTMYLEVWNRWISSLSDLHDLKIPRILSVYVLDTFARQVGAYLL